MSMSSLMPFFLCAVLSSASFIEGRGTKPPDYFRCRSIDAPQRIDIFVETGSMYFAGTDDQVTLLLRDSQGVVCSSPDLDNSGNDHRRSAIDHYAICCPQEFAENNDFLSVLLLTRWLRGKGAGNDWFIENIEVRREDSLIFEYRFHAWTNPGKVAFFGASRVTSSRIDSKEPSYSLIRA